ncbi:MAG: hypothetical protein R6X19_06400 [Kiritimatiellia bacterium]
MIKFLFFDYRQLESVRGFERRLELPKKYSITPLLDSQQAWGTDFLTTYGSVIKRSNGGLFQMWYTTFSPAKKLVLAYAESRDGIEWTRPALDIVKYKGRKTNVVFETEAHGAAVFYDAAETRPGWAYKMMTGAAPSGRIGVFRSADGMHWMPAAENPVIGSNPDCPISFCRLKDGRYVAFHRPGFADRRVGRTESWNFKNFSEAVVVMEPDQNDPPNTQLYGMGSAVYGAYLIGTLWVYHTDPDNTDFYKMSGYQSPEFVHSRGSYCWHRTAQGEPWIPVSREKERFDSGQVQPVSAPVFLKDEIRFYYTGTRTRHNAKEVWKGKGPRAGIGYAACKPDRFVALVAGSNGGLQTRPFWTDTPRFCVNAAIRPGGFIRAQVLELDGSEIPGLTLKEAIPVTGDSTAHVLAWRGNPDLSRLLKRDIRLLLEARNTRLYAIYSGTPEEADRYWDFRIASHVNGQAEREGVVAVP